MTTHDFDLVVRPRLLWRITFPAAALLCLIWLVLAPSWINATGMLYFGAVAVSAWVQGIVIIGPTLLHRSSTGSWTEIDLDHLRSVGRVGTARSLVLHDAEGNHVVLASPAFWQHHEWSRMLGTVALWVRRHDGDPDLRLHRFHPEHHPLPPAP